jgi:hypothetical protein
VKKRERLESLEWSLESQSLSVREWSLESQSLSVRELSLRELAVLKKSMQRLMAPQILVAEDFRQVAPPLRVEVLPKECLHSLLMAHSRRRIHAMLHRPIVDHGEIFHTSHQRATRWDQTIHQSDFQEYVIPIPTLALRFSS